MKLFLNVFISQEESPKQNAISSLKGHGNYLFFLSIRDNLMNIAFWVDAKILYTYKPKELKNEK